MNIQRLEKISIFITKGLIFILPLFFLPWTSARAGMDNYNKLLLLLVVVPILGGIMIYIKFSRSEIRIKRSVFDKFIFLFALAYVLATLFSIDRFSSFFGHYSSLSLPLLSILVLVAWYYFLINFVQEKEQIYGLIKTFLLSFGLIEIITFLIIIGYWAQVFGVNNIFAQFFIFSQGSFEELSILTAIMCVFFLSIVIRDSYLNYFFRSKLQRVLIKFIFVLSIVFLAIVNFKPSWLIVLLGTIMILGFNLLISFKPGKKGRKWKKQQKEISSTNIFWPLVIVLLSLFFIVTSIAIGGGFTERKLFKNLQLDHHNSLEVAVYSLLDRPVLGYGPESFINAYSLHRNPKINNTNVWDFRFNRSFSYFYELGPTVGALGVLSYLLFIGFIIYYLLKASYKVLSNSKDKIHKGNVDIVVLSNLIFLIFTLMLAQFLYNINTILLFLFFFVLALIIILSQELKDDIEDNPIYINSKQFIFNKNQRTSLMRALVIVVFFGFSGWLITLGFEARFWLANQNFANSIRQDITDEEREMGLQKAIELNPYRLIYYTTMAKFYLSQAIEGISELGSGQSNTLVRDSVNNSITYAQKAVAVAPKNVVVYETLGMVYRDISPIFSGIGALAINAFREASNLEPSNPILLAELGKAYINNDQNNEAITPLEKSLKLKPDLLDNKFHLAKVYSAEGIYDKAMQILKELENKDKASFLPEILYEQGKIYFNQKKYEFAIQKFNQVIIINPNHSNAIYSLALSLEATGELSEALEYYKNVLNLNPENKEIEAKIYNLQQ
jgi:cytochrome c-type biogenesis protein CcmH/NrfG